MLSEAKHLLLFEYVGDKQILRFAQNDNQCVYTIRRNALAGIIHERARFFSSPGVYAWVRETTRFLPARFSGHPEGGFRPRHGKG